MPHVPYTACILLGQTEPWDKDTIAIDFNTVGVQVDAWVIDSNTGATLATLLDLAMVDFDASVAQSLAILGAAPWTPAVANKYATLRITIQGGTPAVENRDFYCARPVIDLPASTAVAADDSVDGVTGGIALSNIMPPRGTSDKVYSAAEEIDRNEDPGAGFVQRAADGGPASYKILGNTKTPALNTSALEAIAYALGYAAAEALYATWEAARNTLLDLSKVTLNWLVRQFGTNRYGTNPGGGTPTTSEVKTKESKAIPGERS